MTFLVGNTSGRDSCKATDTNSGIQLSQAVPGSIPGRRIIFFNSFNFLLLLFFLFRPLQPQTIEVRLDYSAFASLEFPKFAWHHHQTLDTYTILIGHHVIQRIFF